jgi:nucleoside-diphosphate kinase
MATERTLSIIKPDATKRNLTGKIVAKFEEAGLRVVASKRIHLTPAQAGAFYAEHAERGFYGELCAFMASEPVVVQVLEGEGAIAKNREVMGATDPAAAAAGTIRKEFALSKGENSVHGSDSARSRSSSRALNWSADFTDIREAARSIDRAVFIWGGVWVLPSKYRVISIM